MVRIRVSVRFHSVLRLEIVKLIFMSPALGTVYTILNLRTV